MHGCTQDTTHSPTTISIIDRVLGSTFWQSITSEVHTIDLARQLVTSTSVSPMEVTMLKLLKPSGRTETGVLRSHVLNEPLSSPTHITVTNSMSMRSTSSGNLLELRCHNIPKCSTLIGPSKCMSPNPTTSSSQVSAVSVTSLPTISSARKGTSHIKTQTNVPRTQSILLRILDK